MNRSIDSSAASQATVGCIHNRIDLLNGDVSDDELQFSATDAKFHGS